MFSSGPDSGVSVTQKREVLSSVMRMRSRQLVPILVVLVMAFGAGASSGQTTTVARPGPARERLDWLVGQMNDSKANEASVRAGFAPSFLVAVPISEIGRVLATIVGGRTGWRVADDGQLGAISGDATISSSDGTKVLAKIGVEPKGAHRITTLFLKPLPSDKPITMSSFDASLRKLGPTAAFGLYDVTKGKCELIHGVDETRPMPIASTFKLWILAALGSEIQAGRASWDETMPIQRALISTPNGEIANAKLGTKVSLRRLAELMISVSDNSATDHLLHRIGRTKVEQAMRDAGVADPSRNIPMISTRELFLMKRGNKVPADVYLKLDEAGRRKALDTTLAGITWSDDPKAAQNTATPAAIDTIEWFASPLDQCRTQLRLAQLATRHGLEPIADFLRKNPGMQFGPEWTDVRFKGGNEAGVVFASWRLVRNDGRLFVLAGGVANPKERVDDLAAFQTLSGGARLVPAA
jgi:hypothetical protein